MVGRAEVGAIVCGLAPPMLKTIVSRPLLALASRIACRSEPGPTVRRVGDLNQVRRKHRPENSDVSPVGEVAVAVM